MRTHILTLTLRWLAVVLILRVLGSIVSNYPDYFPPDFDSLFLQGREATFTGPYRIAFYLHIASGPVVLLNGLVLLSEVMRRSFGRLHRVLGRIQAATVLFILLPSGAIMATQSYGGWSAGASFLALAFATATCTILGVAHALRGRFASHRQWMLRSYVLICSAVVLRLMSGAAECVGVRDAEATYVAAAWMSWLFPFAALVVGERMRFFSVSQRPR
jgi:uncharacterized membrane protein